MRCAAGWYRYAGAVVCSYVCRHRCLWLGTRCSALAADAGSASGWGHEQAMHRLCAGPPQQGHESGGLRALNHWHRVSVRVTLVMVLELIIWLGYQTRAPSHRFSTICPRRPAHIERENHNQVVKAIPL